MKTTDRKAALAAYKKRKVAAGIYALHFDGTDQKWIGYTPDLSKLQNRIRFTLGLGTNPLRDLQTAWNDCGASDLIFEALEQFDPDEAPAGAALQARLAQWRGELNALPA